MTTAEVQQESLWSRLTSLPIVMSAIGQATSIYEHTKESSDILKYSLETAEAGVKTVVDTAKPGQLYQQTKQFYDDKVKTTVDQITNVPERVSLMKSYTNDSIQGVKDYTTSTIDGAKYYTTEVVEGVKEFTQESIQNVKRCSGVALQEVTNYTNSNMDNVKNSTTSAIDSIRNATAKTTQEAQKITKGTMDRVKTLSFRELCDYTSTVVTKSLNSKLVTERLQGTLQATEAWVDYHLPSEHDEKKSDLVCKEDPETMTSIANLSNKARRKLHARSMVQVRQAQLRSKEALGKLTHTVDLIEYARTNIDASTGQMKCRLASAGDNVCYYWHEINRPEVEYIEMKNLPENGDETFEKRMVASARGLVLQLKQGIQLISTHLPILPPQIKDKITSAKDVTEKLYSELTTATSFKDLPERLLEQAKESLGHVQHTLSLVGHHVISSWGVSWLISVTPTRDNALENSQTPQQEATQADEREKQCADEGPIVADE